MPRTFVLQKLHVFAYATTLRMHYTLRFSSKPRGSELNKISRDLPSRQFEHQSLFSEIQALSGVGSFDWNLATNELHWSDHLFTIYGMDRQTSPLRLEDFVERIHPDDRAAVWQGIQSALNGTDTIHQEERIIRADGEVRLLESRGSVIRDSTGKAIRFLGACRDITDQRETESALQWQVSGLALLSDIAKELMSNTATRADWKQLLIRLASHLKCDKFASFRMEDSHLLIELHDGLDNEFVDMIKKTCLDNSQLYAMLHNGQFAYCQASEIEASPYAKELLKHGIRCYVHAPLVDSGELIGVLGFGSTDRDSLSQCELDFAAAASDVFAAAMARSNADEKLRASEARCQLVIDHAKIVIWEADKNIDQFSYVTESCGAFLGFSASEWREPGFWRRRIHPEDLESAENARNFSAKNRRDYRQEYRMRRADGAVLWVEHVVKVLVDDQAVVGLRGALVDVTERKTLERQYLQAQKMEAVGTLTGGISHDFNNLLTAIVANLECAKLIASQNVSEHQIQTIINHVDQAILASERAASTVRQLLVFSRRDASERKATNLNHVVRSATQLLSRAMDASIRIQLDLDELIPMILGNGSQLEHVIFNLCNNSRDAMPDGGDILIATTLRSHDDREWVVLRIRDTGTGMSDETRARMFEPFFTTKSADHGSGLGLAMCYAVVKQHQGTIACTTSSNGGTEFEILLPPCVHPANETALSSRAPESHQFLQSLRILIVDDEDAVRRAISGLLESYGVHTFQAKSGDSATQLLQSSPDLVIDAVLLDRTMPGLDGFETMKEIKRIRPDLPVVLCSGYLREDKPHTQVPAPAGILQKPFTIRSLIRVLRQAIHSNG